MAIETKQSICALIPSLLPICDNYQAGWTPSAHGKNCQLHKLPWRQKSAFVNLLTSANDVDKLCNGQRDCVNGVDELAYICGNYKLSNGVPAVAYMEMAVDPDCDLEVNNNSPGLFVL
jgi:hypothetical protein